MDWFSWLSKTGLDPSLVYEYSLAFSQNELQVEDLTYFDHEFLKSMGIMVAKHRLEILKLVMKEVGAGPLSLSRLIMAINKSKRSVKKCIHKLVSHRDSIVKALPGPEPDGYGGQSSNGAMMRKFSSDKELKVEKPKVMAVRRQAKSGPLDRRVQENWMHNSRSLKQSGPLDGKAQERLVLAYRSPRYPGTPDLRGSQQRFMVTSRSPQLARTPWDERLASPKIYSDYSKEKILTSSDLDDHALWSALFQDLKPT